MLDKDEHFKNRYLIDMIDNIFVEEMDTQKQKMLKLSKNIKYWAKNNELPSNTYATYLKLQMEEEKKLAKQENLREDTALTSDDTQAQKLCKEYNIHVDYLNNENIKS